MRLAGARAREYYDRQAKERQKESRANRGANFAARSDAGRAADKAASAVGFSSVDDAVKRLKAEHDENQCRIDFTPSEAVEMGRRIEAMEKPKAEGRKKAGHNQHTEASEKFSEGSKGETASKAASAVGMSRPTYEKAKAVVDAAAKPGRRLSYLPVYAAGMTTQPVTSWFDVAPAIIAIRHAAYATARDERLPLPEYLKLERRLIRAFALRLYAEGHADWCARVLLLHGSSGDDAAPIPAPELNRCSCTKTPAVAPVYRTYSV